MSMARRTLPSRLELKSLRGSFNDAPLKKRQLHHRLVSFLPVQMRPSWDQTGVPIHFTSSITSGSASLMRARTFSSVFASPISSSAISCPADQLRRRRAGSLLDDSSSYTFRCGCRLRILTT
jgi:hypothetical protein